jgi:hypothetical protein
VKTQKSCAKRQWCEAVGALLRVLMCVCFEPQVQYMPVEAYMPSTPMPAMQPYELHPAPMFYEVWTLGPERLPNFQTPKHPSSFPSPSDLRCTGIG